MSLPPFPGESGFMGQNNKVSDVIRFWFERIQTSVITTSPGIGGLDPSKDVQTDALGSFTSVDNTGSGNNVMSASPTFTGTINLEAISATGAISALSITAVDGTITNDLSVGNNVTVDGKDLMKWAALQG